MLVVEELADDGAAGFPARPGDDDLHAAEAYGVHRQGRVTCGLAPDRAPRACEPAEPDRSACGR
jgi:hypothetical protein